MSESNEVPTYQPQAGLRERIARAIWEDDERAKRDESDDWDAKPLTDHEVYLANADAVLAVLPPQPATSPVPPWPGAVLSGCVDEDGVPTWLAQAGQVRGEQVRGVRNAKWRASTTSYPTEWVEVRAPRAVPVPETERVPLWEAKGERVRGAGHPDGITVVSVGADDDGPWIKVDGSEYGSRLYSLIVPDGTVEVLKDGDQ